MKNVMLVMLSGLMVSGMAYGAPWLQHSGASDPTTEGWTKIVEIDPGNGLIPPDNITPVPEPAVSGLSPDPFDGSTYAWQINDNVGYDSPNPGEDYGAWLTYSGTSTAATKWGYAYANGWSLNLKLRIASEDLPTPVDHNINLFVGDPVHHQRRWMMQFGKQADGDQWFRVLNAYPDPNRDTAWDLHVFDDDADDEGYFDVVWTYNTGTGMVDVSVNGVDQDFTYHWDDGEGGSGYITTEEWYGQFTDWDDRFMWGSVELYGHNISNWADVTWVPEPMTLTVLGLGGLALVRRRRA